MRKVLLWIDIQFHPFISISQIKSMWRGWGVGWGGGELEDSWKTLIVLEALLLTSKQTETRNTYIRTYTHAMSAPGPSILLLLALMGISHGLATKYILLNRAPGLEWDQNHPESITPSLFTEVIKVSLSLSLSLHPSQERWAHRYAHLSPKCFW